MVEIPAILDSFIKSYSLFDCNQLTKCFKLRNTDSDQSTKPLALIPVDSIFTLFIGLFLFKMEVGVHGRLGAHVVSGVAVD